MRAGTASYVAGNTLKTALSTGVRTFVNLVLVSASEELDRKVLTDLLLNLARAFDPGIEMTGMLGRKLAIQIRTAVRLWRNHSPAMDKLFVKMEQDVPESTLSAGIEAYQTGRLPGIDRDIPLVMLSGDRYLDRPVYVRINPYNGDVFGTKYTLSADNQLSAVPLPAARQLKNILHYGLSGRGSVSAAKVWQQQKSVDSLVSVELNGMACTAHISRYGEPGGETVLFPELGISLIQEPLNVGLYEYVFKSLPPVERVALNLWNETEEKHKLHSGNVAVDNRNELLYIRTRINENLWKDLPFTRWGCWKSFTIFISWMP
ncbi:hypothetical protein ABK905_13090 [Acerihabitans sp. KWT182]|uniref:Uncharacterized protein n=1 Tax=Acerihabitans sp. KWT182 TaxID=3157919 RepID=A0AAU7QHW4_9GAMM